VFGDREKMLKNFGVDYDDLMKRLGLHPHDRKTMVYIVPTSWFYE